MAKIRVKSNLYNKDLKTSFNYDVLGVLTDNKLKYIEEDIVVTILMDSNTIEMNRKNDKYNIRMVFNLDKSYLEYYVAEYDLSVKTDIKLSKLEVLDNKLELEYQITDGDRYLFTLEYNVKE